MHSPEQMRKKHEARKEALHHMHHSAVDGKHSDASRAEMMFQQAQQQAQPQGAPTAPGQMSE